MNTPSPSFLVRRAAAALALLTLPLAAQVPQALNYQGRVAVSGAAFTGTGQFRFALVDGAGTALWSSNASATTGVAVADGLYSVRLGDTSLPNMAAVPSALFSNPDLRLRVWFDDGANGLQQLAPDQRLAPVGYAHRAASVDSVPAAAIAPDSIQPSHLAHSLQSGTAAGLASIPAAGGVLNVTFPQAFETPPVVKIDGLPVANVTATGFSLTIPPRNLILDDGTPATSDVGFYRDVILVGGNPAIAYNDSTSGDLKYIRASNAQGTAWNAPVVVAVGGTAIVGEYCSIAVEPGGRPGIAYYDVTNRDLKFVRAADLTGTAWSAPVTVASHATDDLGKGCVLRYAEESAGIVRPFIVWLDATAGTVKVAKAINPAGTSWSSATPVPSLTSMTDAFGFDLYATATGLAIAYYDPAAGRLKVVESASLPANTWGSPRDLSDPLPGVTALDAFTTTAGASALSWEERSSLSNAVAYTALIPDSFTLAAAPVAAASGFGVGHSRVIPGSNPLILYTDNQSIKSIAATNSDATAWGAPHRIEAAPGNSRSRPAGVRLADGSVLAVFQSTTGGGQLRVTGVSAPASAAWEASLASPLLATGVVAGSITRESLAPGFFGNAVRLTGQHSFAVGDGSKALGNASWASGSSSLAAGKSSTAMGFGTKASSFAAMATGSLTLASGESSTAMGTDSEARGDGATAMGSSTVASGWVATAMGSATTASGESSTSMGAYTTASGQSAMATGQNSTASGEFSTAMGYGTTASGHSSTAMGFTTTAAGSHATAIGILSNAGTWGEVSIGMYPVANTGNATARVPTEVLLEVGNGSGVSTTSNALTVIKDGRIGLASMDTAVELTHLLTLPNVAVATGGQGRANAWTTYSDGRIKTEQRPMTYGLREIMRLQPRAYTQHSGCVEHGTFKCEDGKGGSAKTIGFIAQEVEKVIPEAVQKPADVANQLYGMDYEKLIPVLVRATQELKTENDVLKTRLQQTNATLQAMQQRLEKLERPARSKR